jgi:tyrosyl-tRNA synthetase
MPRSWRSFDPHPSCAKDLNLPRSSNCSASGIAAAAASRAGFTAQFSRKRFSDALGVPVIDQAEHGGATVGDLFVRVAQTVPSMSQVRRVASGGGLRLVTETPGKEQEAIVLTEADASGTLASLLSANRAFVRQPDARTFLKCGRSLVEIS